METYTYLHKQLRKIKVAICNHQVDSPFMCSLMSAVVMCQEGREYGHTYSHTFLIDNHVRLHSS